MRFLTRASCKHTWKSGIPTGHRGRSTHAGPDNGAQMPQERSVIEFRRTKHQIFEVSGSNNHTLNGFTQVLGTWTLWDLVWQSRKPASELTIRRSTPATALSRNFHAPCTLATAKSLKLASLLSLGLMSTALEVKYSHSGLSSTMRALSKHFGSLSPCQKPAG